MAEFSFKAMNREGKKFRGKAAAEDEIVLHERLKEEGCYLIEAKEICGKQRFRPLSAKNLSEFCRELGVLLQAGISLAPAMQVISGNSGCQQAQRRIYHELFRKIRQGSLLSEAMLSMKQVFPVILIQMFRAAEVHGNLAGTALKMSDYFQKEYRMQEKLRSAVWYPKFLMGLIICSVIVLLGYVLPQLEFLFSTLEELPLPTRILYDIANAIQEYGLYMFLTAGVGICLVNLLPEYRPLRRMLGKIQIRMPFAGRFWRTIYTARFAEVLSSLYLAGLPMLQALTAAKETIGNAYLEQQFDQVLAKVRSGDSLSDALRIVDGFEEKLIDVVRTGEEADSLEIMLGAAAEDLKYEAETVSGHFLTFMEPFLIVVMAGIVGFIMMAVLLPVYESYTAMELMMYG